MKHISAQICIKQVGLSWDEDESLYCKDHGEPLSVIHNLVKAYVLSRGDWKAGRVTRAITLINEVTSGKYRTSTGHRLRGDISYLYYLILRNRHINEKYESSVWDLCVYATTRRYVDAEIIQWEHTDGSAFASSGYEKPLAVVNLRDYKSLLNKRCLSEAGTLEISRRKNSTMVDIDSNLSELLDGDYIVDGEYLGDDYL